MVDLPKLMRQFAMLFAAMAMIITLYHVMIRVMQAAQVQRLDWHPSIVFRTYTFKHGFPPSVSSGASTEKSAAMPIKSIKLQTRQASIDPEAQDEVDQTPPPTIPSTDQVAQDVFAHIVTGPLSLEARDLSSIKHVAID